jgi:hypothetical protein
MVGGRDIVPDSSTGSRGTPHGPTTPSSVPPSDSDSSKPGERAYAECVLAGYTFHWQGGVVRWDADTLSARLYIKDGINEIACGVLFTVAPHTTIKVKLEYTVGNFDQAVALEAMQWYWDHFFFATYD